MRPCFEKASYRIIHHVPVILLTLGFATAIVSQTSPVSPTSTELQAAALPSHDITWWKHAVLYEIYPRSFQDTNGDGVGDLNGISHRLDYLQHLGVDAIWIAPMYPSPQRDFGYDISNYEAVDPQYGTIADFDRLLDEAKRRNIRIVLDMVLNHTSDKHPWFTESASSRTNPKADWYVWNDGVAPNAKGVTNFQRRYRHMGPHGEVVPPNNWESLFGGSAWEWVSSRQQFYYHKFYREQPDLNWRNPAVEQVMFACMRFWLDKGVAGFRLDAIGALFEDPQLRQERETGGTNAQGDPNLDDIYTADQVGVHDVVRRMRKMIEQYSPAGFPGERVLIGETYDADPRQIDAWYGGAAHDQLQLPMDMYLGFSNPKPGKLDATIWRNAILDASTKLHGSQPLFAFDNHDNPRSWDRFGDGVHDPQIARVLGAVLLTTRSAALLYYGEEIGMRTQVPKRIEDVRDPIGISGWPKEKGRDGERTPMQWSGNEPQAGFSTNPHTWLPVAPDYRSVNVATESADPHSLLNWYRTLIAIRVHNPAMHDGGIVMLDNTNASVLSYLRTAPPDGRPVVISLNMTAQPQTVHLDLNSTGIKSHHIKMLLSDAPSLKSLTSISDFTLPPYAALIAEIK